VVTNQAIAKDVVALLKGVEGPLERDLLRQINEEGTITTTITIM
jgi:hypothetical protein